MKTPFNYFIFLPSGPANEPKEVSGISHFIEHLVFSSSILKSDLQDFIDENNIYDSAATSMASTRFTAWNMDEQTMRELQERVHNILENPGFSREDFEKEKGIIIEEIAYQKRRPYRRALREFDKLIFKDGPIEKTILGTVESVKEFTFNDIQEWFDKFYKETNLVEGIYNEETQELKLEKINTDFPAPEGRTPDESLKREINLGTDAESKIIYMGWTLDNPSPKERMAMEILRSVLGTGPNSFMFERLREELQLVYRMGSSALQFRESSIQNCNFSSTNPEKCLEEFANFTKSPGENISQKSFEVAKNKRLDYFENPGTGIINKTVKDFIRTGELMMPEERANILKNITYEDLIDVSNKLFAGASFQLRAN